MSEIIPINNSTSSFSIEKNEIDKNESQKTKEKSKQINPISLLSKDLLEKINTFDEKNFESKKDNNINDYMQLDETHKDSEENEEEDDEDDYILEIEKENEKCLVSKFLKMKKMIILMKIKLNKKKMKKILDFPNRSLHLIIIIILIMVVLRIQIVIIPLGDLVMIALNFKIKMKFLIFDLIIK